MSSCSGLSERKLCQHSCFGAKQFVRIFSEFLRRAELGSREVVDREVLSQPPAVAKQMYAKEQCTLTAETFLSWRCNAHCIESPARSPDVTPHKYFLQKYLKARVFKQHPQTSSKRRNPQRIARLQYVVNNERNLQDIFF